LRVRDHRRLAVVREARGASTTTTDTLRLRSTGLCPEPR
jgi:hypothetical protein